MGSISKVARIGFAMFLLGVVLLSVLAMFKGNAKGASIDDSTVPLASKQYHLLRESREKQQAAVYALDDARFKAQQQLDRMSLAERYSACTLVFAKLDADKKGLEVLPLEEYARLDKRATECEGFQKPM